MSEVRLLELARVDYEHGVAGTLPQTDAVHRVPAENYVDRERWELEMRRIFRRLPLVLSTTAEMREPGSYKAMTAAGVQVLLTRTKEGVVKAFVNMCSHRGAKIMADGVGKAWRFTCPYHSWTFSPDGDLVSVYLPEDFGEFDKSCHGLTELPVLEKAGIIWGILDPQSRLDIASFLSGYDAMLAEFGFETWHHFASQDIEGPNWKVAYDGYLDYYHLPILHKDSFGTDMHNQATYTSWGPHQRVGRPDAGLGEWLDRPAAEWPPERLLQGVWTIFPHISIANFDGGGRAVMLSQLFPGDEPGKSVTTQHYLMQDEPADEERIAGARAQFAFLKHVVADEDYATGIALQKNLASGAKPHVLFGRNEEGGRNFHRWVDTILETEDEDLPSLFSTG